MSNNADQTTHVTKRIKTIALTGGICSGKSTVLQHLKELIKGYEQDRSDLHFHIIPTDELGWKAYDVDTECYHQVLEVFTPIVKKVIGEETSLIDEQTGQINRRVLGRVVFGDSQLMKQLTDIVWPEVKRLIGLEMKKAEREALENHRVICLIESAVLVEAGWQSGIDEVWVVDVSSEEQRIERLCKRNQLTVEEAKQRIHSQLGAQQVIQKLEEHNQGLDQKERLKVVYIDTFDKTMQNVKDDATKLFEQFLMQK